MQLSHLPFAWLKIIEGFRHQQQDTLLRLVLALMREQASRFSSSTAFFHPNFKTHYLEKLFNPAFATGYSDKLLQQEAQLYQLLEMQ